jgi:hypothetical protein
VGKKNLTNILMITSFSAILILSIILDYLNRTQLLGFTIDGKHILSFAVFTELLMIPVALYFGTRTTVNVYMCFGGLFIVFFIALSFWGYFYA